MAHLTTPDETKTSEWPPEWPRPQRCAPALRQNLTELAPRLPDRLKAPPWWRVASINQSAQWDDHEIELRGLHAKLAAPAGRVPVTWWTWALFASAMPDLYGLAHRDNRGSGKRCYIYAMGGEIGHRLKSKGAVGSKSILLHDLLLVAACLDADASRVRFLDGDSTNLRIWNLGTSRYPLTPDGEEARHARISFEIGREILWDHYGAVR